MLLGWQILDHSYCQTQTLGMGGDNKPINQEVELVVAKKPSDKD